MYPTNPFIVLLVGVVLRGMSTGMEDRKRELFWALSPSVLPLEAVPWLASVSPAVQ